MTEKNVIPHSRDVAGFISTGDGVIPGNNGLWDQILALKWVKVGASMVSERMQPKFLIYSYFLRFLDVQFWLAIHFFIQVCFRKKKGLFS